MTNSYRQNPNSHEQLGQKGHQGMVSHSNMPQTRISQDLGPLPRGLGRRVGHRGVQSLTQILRSLAIQNQRDQPRVFYSLREVAANFRVPIYTVAKIYRDLEHEGLLSRVRASKTILHGLRYERTLNVRAFVGLPVLVSSFLTVQDYRRFYTCIQHELWLRGFAAVPVFHGSEELLNRSLSNRLKAYEVDTVIWLSAVRSARQSLLQLADMGVRVIGVSEVQTPTMPSRYQIWRESGMDTLLRDWRDRRSVRKITIVESKNHRSAVSEEILRVVSEDLGIEFVVRAFEEQAGGVFMRNLSRTSTQGIVFPSATLASMLACQSPDGLSDLLKAKRVAFVDGPIDVAFGKTPDGSVDLVMVDWQAIAECIVSEMATLEAFDNNRNRIFEAQVRFRASLSSFCKTT